MEFPKNVKNVKNVPKLKNYETCGKNVCQFTSDNNN